MGDEGRRPPWWGWGQSGGAGLSDSQLSLIRSELGETEVWRHPSAISDVVLPHAAPLPRQLAAFEARGIVRVDHESRLTHAGGKGYADLARLRIGRMEAAPDAVITPRSAREVSEVIDACAQAGVTVIPYGGGTSVVGALTALRRAGEPCVSLDLGNLVGLKVDSESMIASMGAGMRGPEVERELSTKGLTLGHFPQSFEFATVGGFAATRSAGQASNGYGRFDSLICGLSATTPAGELLLDRTPHSAAGPSLREMLIGSEGTFGVITDVEARVRQAPRQRRYEAWFCDGFEAGAEAVRSLCQYGLDPDVVRLSDEEETRINLAMAGGKSVSLLKRYLRIRGSEDGSLLILGFEGGREGVDRRRSLVARELRQRGAVYGGRRIGEHWAKGRFEGPRLRDLLLDAGVMVETLETAHRWREIPRLHENVVDAIKRAAGSNGDPATVFCHLSHSYPDGASLYFTFLTPVDHTAPIGQWAKIKAAASDAIVANGGTISHHHGVGADHRRWLPEEIGPLGQDVLRAAKGCFDPGGIMNPGKLISMGDTLP